MRTPRILAALVAAVALLSPATAHGATPGVNVDDPTPAHIAEAIATGAKTVRLFASWASLEPSKGAYPSPATPQAASLHAATAQLNAAGVRVLFAVTDAPEWASGSADHKTPPANVADYADFFKRFVATTSRLGKVAGYEVWNEPDEAHFWHPAPDAARYASMLKAAYAAAKQASPAATVITGPTTGNNYEWLEQLYSKGAKGFFDAVSVHTDTACLDRGPENYYRDNGRIARYTFLGYRTMREVMVAHGDGDKPMLMSELGWSSTNGGPTSCKNGMWAGQKPSGVTDAEQATYLARAYACLAQDPYVSEAAWFTLRDIPDSPSDEMRHYGLLRGDGTPKPSLAAFRAVAAAGGAVSGACADFDPPAVRILSPVQSTRFADRIDIQAVASDGGVGLASVRFNYDGGKKIRGFGDPVNDRPVDMSPWYGSVDLSPGRHTIEVVATDKNGNQSTATVTVEKVRRLASTQASQVKLRSASVKRRAGRHRLSGVVVAAPGQPVGASIGGKVQICWQRFEKGRWKTYIKERKTARKPFAFKAKLGKKGKWRAGVTFQGAAPWKKSKTPWLRFRV